MFIEQSIHKWCTAVVSVQEMFIYCPIFTVRVKVINESLQLNACFPQGSTSSMLIFMPTL